MSKRGFLVSLVCEQREQVPKLLAVFVAMGVLLAFSFLFLEPGSPSYAIALVDLALIVGAFASLSGIFWWCTKREMGDFE